MKTSTFYFPGLTHEPVQENKKVDDFIFPPRERPKVGATRTLGFKAQETLVIVRDTRAVGLLEISTQCCNMRAQAPLNLKNVPVCKSSALISTLKTSVIEILFDIIHSLFFLPLV